MRCAIYTRKSSSDGLEQTYNSLHAQRDACASYVTSQAGEGWVLGGTSYDDGGFSGGSLPRPGLQRLLDDIGAGLIDVVVVYKIDRLSRSLRDFVNLLSSFERHGVTFVAITQSFNTTNSIGRLTLNVLLSIAQFEREIISDRLKDKFAASRAKGLWLTGPRPFGFRVEDRLLVVDEAEAAIIRRIYHRYPILLSAPAVAAELNAAGLTTRFGRRFRGPAVAAVLRNRLYCGDMVHEGRPSPGIHERIVSEAIWAKVQEVYGDARKPRTGGRPTIRSPLQGIVFGTGGARLMHVIARDGAKVYRYFVRPRSEPFEPGASPIKRFRAQELEAAVSAALGPFGQPVADEVTPNWSHYHGILERLDVGPINMVLTLCNGRSIEVPVAGRMR